MKDNLHIVVDLRKQWLREKVLDGLMRYASEIDNSKTCLRDMAGGITNEIFRALVVRHGVKHYEIS
jgi:hypothetical protein